MTSPAKRIIALVVTHAGRAATVLRFDLPPADAQSAVLIFSLSTFRRIYSSLNPFLPVFLTGGLTLSRSPA